MGQQLQQHGAARELLTCASALRPENESVPLARCGLSGAEERMAKSSQRLARQEPPNRKRRIGSLLRPLETIVLECYLKGCSVFGRSLGQLEGRSSKPHTHSATLELELSSNSSTWRQFGSTIRLEPVGNVQIVRLLNQAAHSNGAH